MWSHTTHATLLARLSAGVDPAAWQEFCERYSGLIRRFAVRHDLQPADCDEVAQDVLMGLAQSMRGFKYDPAKGKFRSYLKTVVLHEIYRKLRQKKGEVLLEDIEAEAHAAADDSKTDQMWEDEWRQYHLRQAMSIVRMEFGDQDLAAFDAYAVRGLEVRETADGLGLSVDQVYQAKSRILKRLGQIIDEQIREEG